MDELKLHHEPLATAHGCICNIKYGDLENERDVELRVARRLAEIRREANGVLWKEATSLRNEVEGLKAERDEAREVIRRLFRVVGDAAAEYPRAQYYLNLTAHKGADNKGDN